MAVTASLARRAAIAAVLALAATAAALAVAVAAAAGNRAQGRALAARLVPAAAAAGAMTDHYTAAQTALRGYVTTGRPAGLAAFDRETAGIRVQEARLAGLAGGYRGVPAAAAAAGSAAAAWQARVAAPQIAAVGRGDLARARAMQADIARTRPWTLAVRVRLSALAARINGWQARVAGELVSGQRVLVLALAAVCAVVAVTLAAGLAAVRRWLLAPVRALGAAAEAVAAGRYGTRVPEAGPAELAALGASTEAMRTRLAAALSRAEQAEGKFRALFDAAPDAALTVAAGGQVLMANAQAGRIFGYGPGELAGQPAARLLPAAADAPADYLAQLGPEPTEPRTTTAVTRDGREFPVEATVTVLPGEAGLTGLISLRDITARLASQAEAERLRAEAERERSARRTEQSQRMESLGQLVGGVAHDFNNLLGVITGYAELLTEDITALAQAGDERLEPALADAGEVQAAAGRAAALTRQLLAFARRDIIHPEPLDLSAAVAGVEHMLRRTLGERIDLVTSLEPGLDPVLADPGQLDQVLVNLAVNAADAMPGGGKLTIDTAAIAVDDAYADGRPGLQPGPCIRLRVSDTGTGMDPQTAARVFEPFYTTKPPGKGTGLGLATVHGIITRAGGYAGIYSEPGMGTTITILLPATTQPARQADAGEAAEPPRGRGEAILLAEDEPALAALVRRVLDRAGYHVNAATTPQDVLRLASDLEQPASLLLTDAVMPGMLGSEVAARIRALRPGLPVLYMSGYAQPVLDTHGALDPGTDLLEKPFTEAALLTRVRHAIDAPAQPAPHPPPAGDPP